MWYTVRRLYCVAFWSVDIPSYNITESVSSADMSDYPIDDVFVFVSIVVASLAGIPVLGDIKFGLCHYRQFLSSVAYQWCGVSLSVDTVFGIPSKSMGTIFFCTPTMRNGHVVLD